ncbi:alpha/beta fold hydrolase [Paracoccus sp. SCSIO 75233]|uniref:alpha/beta fold hydrolase n=1 Tax=Paracoccus sp. SCSIO 75233 TaxID=3017782 RepID=UPI0022F0C86A|nr:alpha/beta hydrolase [Paracoccus sp. SCSIO 75233]WBU52500.1 alpha/beta hydrolase [Paracoccus sp. SCSIO 75233]
MTFSPAPFHQFAGSAETPAEAFWLRSDDDLRLRIALWRAENPTATVLLFPGRTEYVEKYAPVAARLTAEGLNVLAIDWRGQGMADRLQDDPRPGHITDFAEYQLDVLAMVEAAADLDLAEPWHLLAHSMGGAIGFAALLNGLPVQTATFSAPMFDINHAPMPRFVAIALAAIAGRLGRGGHAAIGTGGGGNYLLDETFRRNMLTNDAEAWARLLREAATWPELTLGGASYQWVAAALNECQRLADADAPDIPTLITLGSHERIVSAPAIRNRAASWPTARLLEIDGAQHEVLFEAPLQREQFYEAFLEIVATQNSPAQPQAITETLRDEAPDDASPAGA